MYHDAYPAQLVGALRDTYRRLSSWLGHDGFERAALWHIAEHPPHSWTLGDYGVRFPHTLDHLYRGNPEFADIARLEWAIRRVSDDRYGNSLEPQMLIISNRDEAVLNFTPTLCVVTIRANCLAIWTAIDAGQVVSAPSSCPDMIDVVVWRNARPASFRSMEALEATSLSAAREGLSLAGVRELLAVELGDARAKQFAGRLWRNWINEGLVIGIECRTSDRTE